MDRKIRSRAVLPLSLIVALLTAFSGYFSPVRASAAIVPSFFAGCTRFSVSVTVQGVADDGNGFDKFRYMVVDGSGKTLYAEDSSRQTHVQEQAAVLDLPYDIFALTSGGPAQNPIHFYVIDLDSLNRPGAILQDMTYNAPCLLPSNAANAPANFMTLVHAEATLTSSTLLYYSPAPLSTTKLSVPQGSKLSAVYQSVDGQWVSVLVGPNDMVWVPASVVNIPAQSLPVQPIHIDLSQTVTGAVAPTGVPVGTARAAFEVRLRAAPTTASAILTVVEFNDTVTVLGTNAARTWYAVVYKGIAGWVSAPFVQLLDVARANLPVLAQ